MMRSAEEFCDDTTDDRSNVSESETDDIIVIEPLEGEVPSMSEARGMKRKKTQNSPQKKIKLVSWKVRYQNLKDGKHDDTVFLKNIQITCGMTSSDTYLPQLIRYMLTLRKPSDSDMGTWLKTHSKYKCAKALIAERVQDCIEETTEPNPWCLVAAIVIVSEYVTDIQEIYQVLRSSTSPSTANEVVECFYCLATFLLNFTNRQRNATWNGMHYRLYYALYLLENESSDQVQGTPGHGHIDQQAFITSPSGSTLPMTKEQREICNHEVADGEVVKIISYAGTGKTTTLVQYTKQRPHLRFLLIVYNRSVADHSKTIFPSNVKCMTGHELAMQYVGKRYRNAGLFDPYWLKINNILNHISLCKGENKYAQARFVLDTINKYMASADPTIDTKHVSGKVSTGQHKMHYSNQATKVWGKMADFGNKEVKMTHDGYMKQFQLEKPAIDQYDVILIDEAQDMTPALADVLLSQDKATMLVGDEHQQIYGFRGAVNTLQMVNASRTFHLTQSFRFGSQIGFVADSCLSVLKGERKKTLVGNGTTGSIRGEVNGQLAVIARSNYELFSEAVRRCSRANTSETVAFVGGLDSFDFSKILDISALNGLYRSTGIKDKLIQKFKTIGELERFAERTHDVDLISKMKIAKTYGRDLPGHVKRIRSHSTSNIGEADVVFSTAHKSKGLEFSTVCLTGDYVDTSRGLQVDVDEYNLLYVAATRAQNSLILTDALKDVLKRAGETFIYPVLTTDLTAPGVEMRCWSNNASFIPSALTLVIRKVSKGEHFGRKLMVYSPSAVNNELPHLRQLYGRRSKVYVLDGEDYVVETEYESDEDEDEEGHCVFSSYDDFIDYALAQEVAYEENEDSEETSDEINLEMLDETSEETSDENGDSGSEDSEEAEDDKEDVDENGQRDVEEVSDNDSDSSDEDLYTGHLSALYA